MFDFLYERLDFLYEKNNIFACLSYKEIKFLLEYEKEIPSLVKNYFWNGPRSYFWINRRSIWFGEIYGRLD